MLWWGNARSPTNLHLNSAPCINRFAGLSVVATTRSVLHGVFLAGLAAAMAVFLWKIATNPGADLGGV